MRGRRWARRGVLAFGVLATAGVVAATALAATTTVVEGLDNPRGLTFGPGGRLVIAESLTGVTDAKLKKKEGPEVRLLTAVPGVVDVAVADGLGRTYGVVGADAPENGPAGASTLVRARPGGEVDVIADIAAYQQSDPDEADLEGDPTESNANGLGLLGDGKFLVADAAGNDVLLVDERTGDITTVARFLPEQVPWPAGEPPFPAPPPGTPVPAEAVPTSVTVGPDGAYYVTELKGFPFSPGTSRIWRIEPGSVDAVCDPANDDVGPCTTVASGFSSLIDLAFGSDGAMYPLEIAKESLWAVEILGAPPLGALYRVKDGTKTELAGNLLFPGGVAVGDGEIYVTTGAVFGPDAGSVVRVSP